MSQKFIKCLRHSSDLSHLRSDSDFEIAIASPSFADLKLQKYIKRCMNEFLPSNRLLRGQGC